MKKILITVILLIVIAGLFSFVLIKWSFLQDGDNYFNSNWRQDFAASSFLRRVFSLHESGDAVKNYLGDDYDRIFVEIDLMKGLRVRETVFEQLAERIEKLTGKRTDYIISDRNIPYQDSVTETELDSIVSLYRDYDFEEGTAYLYLLYISQDHEEADILGATYEEYGVILFGETLLQLVETNPEVFGEYQLSTALHEFGHQLGLEHNDKFHCLMNPAAERTEVGWQNSEDVVTSFCEMELQNILEIKNNLEK